VSVEEVVAFRRQSAEFKASDSLLDYVQRLIAFTREKEEFHFGLSPRGSLVIMRSAKTWALMCGLFFLSSGGRHTRLLSVVEHRLRAASDDDGHSGASLVQRLLNEVDLIE